MEKHLELQTPGRNFINQIGSLIILVLIVLCFSHQIVSVGNQVAGAVAMASLAVVCGLMEQKVISTQKPETLTALKSANDFFCTPVSSSAHRAASFRDLNKHLERPPMEGGVRSVLVCQHEKNLWCDFVHMIIESILCLLFSQRCCAAEVGTRRCQLHQGPVDLSQLLDEGVWKLRVC